eukprot:5859720-Amphidinium_carterae.1
MKHLEYCLEALVVKEKQVPQALSPFAVEGQELERFATWSGLLQGGISKAYIPRAKMILNHDEQLVLAFAFALWHCPSIGQQQLLVGVICSAYFATTLDCKGLRSKAAALGCGLHPETQQLELLSRLLNDQEVLAGLGFLRGPFIVTASRSQQLKWVANR